MKSKRSYRIFTMLLVTTIDIVTFLITISIINYVLRN